MKRFRMYFWLLCGCLAGMFNTGSLVAQNVASDLRTFTARANAGSEISFVFSATDNKGKEIYRETGKATLSGNKYRMDVPGDLLVVNNGFTRWIYKPAEEELVIASNNPSEDDVLENPFAVLNTASNGKLKNYTVSVVKRTGTVGKELQGVPDKIILTAIAGAKYTIRITGFKLLTGLPDTFFELDPKKYAGVIITDLR